MHRSRSAKLKVMGLGPDASLQEIKSAYKRLALKWHPDRHIRDKEEAARTFIEINKAYHALLEDTELSQPREQEKSRHSPHSRPPANARSQSPVIPPRMSHSKNSPADSDSSSSDSTEAPITPRTEEQDPTDCIGKSRAKKQPPPHHVLGTASPLPHYAHHHERHSEPPVCPPLLVHTKLRKPSKRMQNQPARIYIRADTPNVPQHGLSMPKSKHHSRSEHPIRHHSSRAGVAATSSSTTSVSPEEQRYPATQAYPRSDDWICPIKLTLSELFTGKTCRFRLYRQANPPHKTSVEVDLYIRPGSRNGALFVCKGMGNERKDGTFQNIVFVVEEQPHERFARVNDDLMLDVRIPRPSPSAGAGHHHYHAHHGTVAKEEWDDRQLKIDGMNGEEYFIEARSLSHPNPGGPGVSQGLHVVVGAGMPIRQGNINHVGGRGDLIIRWEFSEPQPTKWRALKNLLHEVISL